MKEKTKTTRGKIILRILLTALCALVYAWIFSNSAKTGAQSSTQSYTVTKTVQKVAGVIAPESAIATASGDALDRLHNAIRTLAHFYEFALLGALLVWCYFSYTKDKSFAFLPFALILLTPIFDETVQSFTSGRVAEIADLFVDTAGGLAGCLFAFITVFIGGWIGKKRRKKKEEREKTLCKTV